ncbi:hypothetical protein AX14_007832 [Amanita brunnescens Koide BX004]|nr:hypothetical protein AX14_007832 [Amanita brunnescens Koide BX004]
MATPLLSIPSPSPLMAHASSLAHLPFISGTNLDEGTAFVNPLIKSEDIVDQILIANYSPPIVALQVLKSDAEKLIELYPNDPAFGSPFNTTNETVVLSPYFKQAAAIAGDLSFQSQRRSWMQTASRAGVRTFGYLFTEPQPGYPPALGVFHGAELPFLYGGLTDTSLSAMELSRVMIDYWISFATSLDPNDGHGTSRPHWEQYTPRRQALMQLDGGNLTMIPDDYRMEQIDFINSHPLVWLR